MQAHDAGLLRDLLTAHRVLALAVVADGEPVLGMVPFDSGRLVAGFARTVDLRPDTLRRAATAPASEEESSS
jgi:hypothetical protein